jgi:hypothetical protein
LAAAQTAAEATKQATVEAATQQAAAAQQTTEQADTQTGTSNQDRRTGDNTPPNLTDRLNPADLWQSSVDDPIAPAGSGNYSANIQSVQADGVEYHVEDNGSGSEDDDSNFFFTKENWLGYRLVLFCLYKYINVSLPVD